MFCEDFDPTDDTIRRLFELMMVELANKREALVHKPAAGSIRKRFGSMSNLQMSASYHGYHSQSTGNLRHSYAGPPAPVFQGFHSGQSSVSGSFIPGSYVPPGSILARMRVLFRDPWQDLFLGRVTTPPTILIFHP